MSFGFGCGLCESVDHFQELHFSSFHLLEFSFFSVIIVELSMSLLIFTPIYNIMNIIKIFLFLRLL